MKRSISIIAAFVLLTLAGKTQVAEKSLLGSHAGFHNWERMPITLELKENSVYIITVYNKNLEPESVVKGRWNVVGDHVVLTDLLGAETTLKQYNDECYIVGANGTSCVARFQMNKDLKKYWGEQLRTGC